MYILPGYVKYYEENSDIYISKLRQNTVKLTDAEIIEEIKSVA